MIKRGTLIIGTAITLVVGSAGVSAAIADTGSPHVSPAIRQGDASFYSQAQIPEAWTAATAAVPESLPAGVTYPKEAPPLLFGDGTSNNIYEQGLPEELATRWWRCAWIDYSQSGAAARDGKTAEVQKKLSKWKSFTAVEEFDGLEGYEEKMSALAQRLDESPLAAEFRLDCGSDVYNTGSGK